jgi:hypothetical protein
MTENIDYDNAKEAALMINAKDEEIETPKDLEMIQLKQKPRKECSCKIWKQ